MEYKVKQNTSQKIWKEIIMEYINNDLATKEVAENAEGTIAEGTVEQVEQPVKTYTDEEVNQIVGKKLARREAKLRKEYDRKYGELESVLKAGTGKENVEEMTSTFRDFYEKKGVQMPTQPSYTDREVEVLARAEADEIIGCGFDEVVEETDRLANLGVAHMTAKEKVLFRQLAEYRQNTEKGQELAKIGVTEDVYNSKEFRDFASKFNSNTPVTEIYELYHKMQPRKPVQTMGSMRNGVEPKVKDFYTQEEIERLTEEDLDNEDVWNAVRRSMTGQR